jgi:uncharacterized protein YndB with AHSA1/START domain
MKDKRDTGKPGDKGLFIERVFDAPRETVWDAWTNPEIVKKWWGPKFFSSPHIEIDFREGGKYLYCMRSPDGKDYWSTGVFQEIIEFKKLVLTDDFADEKGNPVSASYYGMSADLPMGLLVTFTFDDRMGKTYFTLAYAEWPGGIEIENARQGWNESLDKLAEYLSSMN